MLENIHIILVNPSHPGNIGSVARAMKNMGLSKLNLVATKVFPHPKAHELACGADNILEKAYCTQDLPESLQHCQLILGTSARHRELAVPAITPKKAAEIMLQYAPTQRVAILFGREHAGLTNEELALCHYQIIIPAHPEYSALNLAQAVQVIAYEIYALFCEMAREESDLLHCQKMSASRPEPLAKAQDVHLFFNHLETLLKEINFIKPNLKIRLLFRLKRLFNRIQLEQMEVNLLRGILSALEERING